MIEVGGIYKLKKIKDFFGTNTEDEFKVLKISGSTVYCQNQETKELNMFNIKDFIDPEYPDDIYSDFEIIMEKLNNVMRPMNLTFWKDLKEDAMASTCAAVPALSTGGISGSTGMAALGTTPTTGCRVNGIAVAGQSVKSKKKKKKKNEAVFSGIVVEQEEIDNFDIQQVKHYFQKNIQQQEVFNSILQDTIKIVGKTWTETQSHIGKNPFFLLFQQLDYILQTATGDNVLVKNTKERKDEIIGWYYLYNTALFGQNLIQIKLDIANTKNNKKVYFLRQKETASGTPSNVLEHCHVGRNTVPNNIITEEDKNVNDLNLLPDVEYNLTPYFHITLLSQKQVNETIKTLSLDDIIEQVEETFDPQDILCCDIKNNREYIRVQVGYTNPEDKALTHTINLMFLDEVGDVLDQIQQENLTQEECLDILNELAYNHTQVELDEEFHEEYEEITQLLAQQLDRMNFEFANTKDIVYKKEGKNKYLLKFDNEHGILKFKVSHEDNVLFEKEWQLEEGQDISPIFKEIEEVYEEYGI